MSKIHLLHGLPGTGKSTYARTLHTETNAVILNHDEWMTTLYGDNPPAEHFADYHQRVLNLIWKMTAEFVLRDIDVILDHGFWTRTSRDQARAKAHEFGANPKLYTMVCPSAMADVRVLKRGQNSPDTLYIDQAALDLFRSRYEPIRPEEECINIDTSNPQGN